MKKNRIDLSGMVFGDLTVVSFSHSNAGGHAHWRCQCSCGRTKVIAGGSLRGGLTKTCGHKRAANFLKHGLFVRYNREFRVWQQLIQRCTNPKNDRWDRYGGRGISVCERWIASFPNFLEDMGPRPSDQHSIERLDNDREYSPRNCVWATQDEQNINKSTNTRVVFGGETKTIAEWSVYLGIPADMISSRLRGGWLVEDALKIARGFACSLRARDAKGRFLVGSASEALMKTRVREAAHV